MRSALFFLIFVGPLFVRLFQLEADAAPSGPLVKHLSSLVKWSRSAASKSTSPTDVNVLQFEEGYLVETVVEGNELGVVPYSIRVSQDGELYAVDAVNSNIVRITPPLSHYSRARLVAGSFQGLTGHVDGKPTDARFNHPKGVTMDDKGNVYVADTTNLAIRKIGEAGVTTIAGGKSNVAGYRDGPSEDAKFSSDFDVIYVRPTCSLLVIDRGNAALRQISLNKEDCEYENSSVSSTDLLMVAGAVLIGYVSCMLQQGFGSTLFSKQADDGPKHDKQSGKEIPTPVGTPIQDEQEAGWPSFGQLVSDLCKFSLESLASIATQFIPFKAGKSSTRGLTPLKDSLIMPEDEARPATAQKHRAPPPISETRQTPALTPMERFAEVKPTKTRTSTLKDPSLSTKHKSSRRQEYAEFYSSGEIPPQYTQQVRSKSQKDRTKHRHREKSGESTFGSSAMEPKPAEVKPTAYESSKYDPYNFRNKYGGDTYRYE